MEEHDKTIADFNRRFQQAVRGRLQGEDDPNTEKAATLRAAGTLMHDYAAALEEIERLRRACAEAYQFAGALGAPERVLDNLAAAADGRPLPHETFLPVSADECHPLPARATGK